MSITAQAVSDRVGILLNDTTALRWTLPERLVWINDGRREMAGMKPQIFGASTLVTHTLAAGCRQRFDTANAYKIDRIDRTVGGSVIRVATREQLDAFKPTWQNDTGTAVQNWFADEVDPLAFYVYPAVAGAQIEAHLYISPSDLSDLTQVALPFDQWLSTLVNYVMFRAYSKEDEAGAAEKAQAFYALFTSALS